MNDGSVNYSVSDGVAVITLDRPQAMNALNRAMRDGLWAGFRRLAGDEEAAVGVLTGNGEQAFCAGADLKEIAAEGLTIPPSDYLPHLNRNFRLEKPVLAAVNGVALGGGFWLAQMCDLCLAAENASFGVTEARWGRGMPWAAPLPWLISPRVAMEMFLTAEPITAARAYQLGLVNRVVAGPQLMPTAIQMAKTIAANAPLSVKAAKAMVYATASRPWSDALDEAGRIFAPVYESEDAREGAIAFTERRPPRWQGK